MLYSLDLEPQEGDIWPDGQVHIFGLEQNPSPQECRQMAVNKTRGLLAHGFCSRWFTGTQSLNEKTWALRLLVNFAIMTYVTLGLGFIHLQNKSVGLNNLGL